jgi:hypothetical protein
MFKSWEVVLLYESRVSLMLTSVCMHKANSEAAILNEETYIQTLLAGEAPRWGDRCGLSLSTDK